MSRFTRHAIPPLFQGHAFLFIYFHGSQDGSWLVLAHWIDYFAMKTLIARNVCFSCYYIMQRLMKMGYQGGDGVYICERSCPI